MKEKTESIERHLYVSSNFKELKNNTIFKPQI